MNNDKYENLRKIVFILLESKINGNKNKIDTDIYKMLADELRLNYNIYKANNKLHIFDENNIKVKPRIIIESFLKNIFLHKYTPRRYERLLKRLKYDIENIDISEIKKIIKENNKLKKKRGVNITKRKNVINALKKIENFVIENNSNDFEPLLEELMLMLDLLYNKPEFLLFGCNIVYIKKEGVDKNEDIRKNI